MFSKLSGDLEFNKVFGMMRNLDTLKTTLDQDDRWFRVGEKVFKNGKYAQEGNNALKEILNSYQFIQARDFITSYIENSHPKLTWDEFKQVGFEVVDGLDALSFKDTDVVSKMLLEDKDKIARKLAPSNGWKHYLDYFEKDENRKKTLKTSFSLKAASIGERKTPTEKLTELIFMYFPDYTMEQFFNACKECHYNDSLRDLMEICAANST